VKGEKKRMKPKERQRGGAGPGRGVKGKGARAVRIGKDQATIVIFNSGRITQEFRSVGGR